MVQAIAMTPAPAPAYQGLPLQPAPATLRVQRPVSAPQTLPAHFAFDQVSAGGGFGVV